MEDKIFDIVTDLLTDDITKNEAIVRLSALFKNVGQREKLLAFCEWLSERDFTCEMTSPQDWVEMYVKSEQLVCDCSQGKGVDIDEEGFPYCIDCQKNVAN